VSGQKNGLHRGDPNLSYLSSTLTLLASVFLKCGALEWRRLLALKTNLQLTARNHTIIIFSFAM